MNFLKVTEMGTRTNQLKIEILSLLTVKWKKACIFLLYSSQNSKSCLHVRHMKDGFNYPWAVVRVCVPGVQTAKWKTQSLSGLL